MPMNTISEVFLCTVFSDCDIMKKSKRTKMLCMDRIILCRLLEGLEKNCISHININPISSKLILMFFIKCINKNK